MSQKRTFDIKCADCGKNAKVPFKPTVGKPAYCRSCFSKRRLKPQVVGVRGKPWSRRGYSWQGRREESTSIFQKP